MIRVLVDSSADLPSDVATAMGIEVVPIHVRFGSVLVADHGKDGRAEFWHRLAAPGPLPEIVPPSAGAFAECLTKLADEGAAGVVAVTPSRRISASHEAAVLAAEAVQARIPVRVVESQAVSYAYGIVALAAASAAAGGAELKESARSAAAEVGKSTTLIVVDTIEFLLRSRRMGRMQSWLAQLLDLKPLLESVDGVMTAAGTVRGRKRGRDLIVSRANTHRTSANLAVVHAAASDIESLRTRVQGAVDRTVIATELGPVITCHTGPEAVGLVYGRS